MIVQLARFYEINGAAFANVTESLQYIHFCRCGHHGNGKRGGGYSGTGRIWSN